MTVKCISVLLSSLVYCCQWPCFSAFTLLCCVSDAAEKKLVKSEINSLYFLEGANRRNCCRTLLESHSLEGNEEFMFCGKLYANNDVYF